MCLQVWGSILCFSANRGPTPHGRQGDHRRAGSKVLSTLSTLSVMTATCGGQRPQTPFNEGSSTTPGRRQDSPVWLVCPSPMGLGQYHADHTKLSCPQLIVTRQKWLVLPLKKDHSMQKQQPAARREGQEACTVWICSPG